MPLKPGKIYKVMHSLECNGESKGICITDLQLDEGVCYLVFNWTTNHDGEYPSHRHPVDPRRLVPVKDPAHDYLIRQPVKVPWRFPA